MQQQSLVYRFLLSPQARIWRHLALLVYFTIVSLNQALVSYQTFKPIMGNTFYWITIATILCYMGTEFRKAVNKAIVYHSLLLQEEMKHVETVEDDYIFVKTDRKYFKVQLEDILFIEGLKDYVIIQMEGQRIITRMSLKAIAELLPASTFLRINKSYIVNKNRIDSFDNNDVFIKDFEIGIGNVYRDEFFQYLMNKALR